MRRFGLIGRSLDHSFSPAYFKSKFEREEIDDEYVLCPLTDISEFKKLKTQAFAGWNVTIPYKEEIISCLDELSEDAQAIGAVNTIEVAKDGRLIGHNTDHLGFERSLLPFLEPADRKALVLGTGGASKAVVHVLKRRGIIYKSVSRTPSRHEVSYEEASAILPHVEMVINTTPAGTFPDTEAAPPIPLDRFTGKHFLIDLIYNPKETAFLRAGRISGARTLNGLSMLHEQAEEAWRIWNPGV